MQKHKAVLDTNILISALGWVGNEAEAVRSGLKGDYIIVISPEILEELADVVKRPCFGFTNEEIDLFFEALISGCELVYPAEKLAIIKEDPDDNKILEAAIAGNSNYIVSGDAHLLNLKDFAGIKILKARELLDLLKTSKVE